MNEDGIIEQEMIELCGSSDIVELIAYAKQLRYEFDCLDANTQTKLKHIKVNITEHDVDTYFKHLLETGHEFSWSIDGVVVEFVSTEHKKRELQNQIDALKDSMEHTGYGSKDLRILASLYQQLEELE